jgi:hypothetical protein
MKQYKKFNNLLGWIVFCIAAIVYCLTIEPTASFWDCGEFIISGYKLEVGHPAGAPFFMLTANFFTQFVSDPSLVACMVNYMSALISDACVMFLFWSITHLVKKLVMSDEKNITAGQFVIVMASGLVGALVYTFSDTFWFSAVESEVYAYSSLFTAVVFWLILKWEEVADQPHSDRWIILIAYLTGLSIGVHLLNLLCLPAIVLIYYYKKNPSANIKGSLLALAGSAVLVAAVLYGVVPGIVKVGGWFELLFVNGMDMPFNTGVIIYVITLIIIIIWSVYETYANKNRKRMNLSFLITVAILGIPFYGYGVSSVVIGLLILGGLSIYLFSKNTNKTYRINARTMNTALLSSMMMIVGYSSYALIMIRSTANPPMDQDSPEDVFTLGEYLGREQYGTRPLFYGQTYSSRVALDVKGEYCQPRQKGEKTKYIRKVKQSPEEKDRYREISANTDYEYAQNMLFPRMYSSSHANEYKQWVNVKGHTVPYDQCGERIMVTVPTQWENIKFFFSYQLNFMYWRYFMWNFAGRQNDIQGNGEIENGNWITGISFIDNLLIDNQKMMPQELKNNKGHNVYYCLPLLLGIIGLLWQGYRGAKGIRQFWVVFFLFFMTGIAIVVYLNQVPSQPRERDYAYAGSFYAFAIWIGMGVAGVAHLLQKYGKMKEFPAALLSLVCLLVPVQMAGQTWDDHDRSGRYVCRDFGQNYLMSLQESGNPIIFTCGDNDTFPLWYNQETEGFRTDARTCNLSYLQTDWYIDQMKRPAYDSPAVPITWNRAEYADEVNNIVYIRPEVKEHIDKMYGLTKSQGKSEPVSSEVQANISEAFGDNPYELKNILKYWVRSKNEGLRIIPTDSMVIKIDKEAVRRSGMMIPAALGDSIPDYMHISLKGKRVLYKSELMMLEMLANANWERPIYIAISVGPENRLGMENHFIQEGLAYRFTPFDTKALDATIDSEKMYDNLMTKFKFGGIDKPGIYLDENTMRMCLTHRRLFIQVAMQLWNENEKEKALNALNYCEQKIPDYNVPHEHSSKDMAKLYYQLGEKEKADKIMGLLADNAVEYASWYMGMNNLQMYLSLANINYYLSSLNDCIKTMNEYKSERSATYTDLWKRLEDIYKMRTE